MPLFMARDSIHAGKFQAGICQAVIDHRTGALVSSSKTSNLSGIFSFPKF
jgi:hypothetical protein